MSSSQASLATRGTTHLEEGGSSHLFGPLYSNLPGGTRPGENPPPALPTSSRASHATITSLQDCHPLIKKSHRALILTKRSLVLTWFVTRAAESKYRKYHWYQKVFILTESFFFKFFCKY